MTRNWKTPAHRLRNRRWRLRNRGYKRDAIARLAPWYLRQLAEQRGLEPTDEVLAMVRGQVMEARSR